MQMALFNSYLSLLPFNRNFNHQFIPNFKFQKCKNEKNKLQNFSIESVDHFINNKNLTNLNQSNIPLKPEYQTKKFDQKYSNFQKSKRNFYSKIYQISEILYNNSYSFLQTKGNDDRNYSNNNLYVNPLKTTQNFSKSNEKEMKNEIKESKTKLIKTRIDTLLQKKICFMPNQKSNLYHPYEKEREKVVDKNILIHKNDFSKKKEKNDLNNLKYKKIRLKEISTNYSISSKNKLKKKIFQKWQNNFKIMKAKMVQILLIECATKIQQFYRRYLDQKRKKFKDSVVYLFHKLKAVYQGWKVRKIMNSSDIKKEIVLIIKLSEQIKNENGLNN